MALNYTLKKSDVLSFYVFYYKEESFIFKNVSYFFAVLFAVFLALQNEQYANESIRATNGIHGSGYDILFSIFLHSAFMLIVLLVTRKLSIKKMQRMIDKNPSLHGPRRLEWNDEVLIFTSHVVKSEYPFSSIKRMVKFNNCLFLFVDSSIAQIIPTDIEGIGELIDVVSKRSNILMG